MRLTIPTILTTLSLFSFSLAQNCAPYTKSPLFHLKLSSSNDVRLNNSILVSSHSGPPYRQLVPTNWYKDTYGQDFIPAENSTRFFFNSSSTGGSYPCPGNSIGWELGDSSGIADSGLQFRTSRVSNIWVAYLYPGPGDVAVGFDENEKMYLWENGIKWYRWFVCKTVWGGSYRFESLVWVVGGKGPDDEGCKAVDVLREWV
ncbi:hypothetical protein QBC38DRAFT_131048 [Podospora fimiseda]|uniref:DUF7907 domain-containing protein n=1 Tax=Podospora fimiseda TaxID=252190 RepID=A0AAN6YLC1_9PEZI|nr:hypothetical protein QBC38DRAFT_131048 [Podospora fimiseda]